MKVKKKKSKEIDKFLNHTRDLKKLMVKPVIVGAQGTVPKDLENKLADQKPAEESTQS